MLSKDVFIRKRGDGKYVVFSPLNRSVSLVNKALLLEYKKWLGSDDVPDDKLKLFKDAGLVVDFVPKLVFEEFNPTYVTIFPTSDCNLRCVYCYASAGIEKKTVDLRTALAGVDLVVENALKLNAKKIGVSFHGGGEPAFAWDTVAEIVGYSKSEAAKHNLEVRLSTVTNGVLTDEQISWMIGNFDRIQVSMDGPEDIQNAQRPLYKPLYPNLSGSYEGVMATFARLNEVNYPYNVRTTITALGVNRLDELLDFFMNKVKTRRVHFEPLYECGRCATTKWREPDHDVYCENYLRVMETAEQAGFDLTTSLGNLSKVSRFYCGGAGTNFCVTPEGFVSSCYEITLKSDPRSEFFFFGKFNPDYGKFEIDEDKRGLLLSRHNENMDHCSRCFLKWTCSGDCLARFAHEGDMFDTSKHSRCRSHYKIASEKLDRLLR